MTRTSSPSKSIFVDELEEEQKNRGVSGAAIAGVAAGAAIVAASAVYLLTGERGEENREKLRQWMKKIRRMNAEKYGRVMDSVFGDKDDERYDRIR